MRPAKQEFLGVKNLTIAYKGMAIVDDVSFSISPNEIVTLIGPNGGGKSTLARALVGITNYQRGTITKAAKMRIGYVPQNVSLNPLIPMSAKQFLHLSPFYNHQLKQDLLSRLRLAEIENYQFSALSGGEKQRVLLARALLNSPQLLILDEPAQGLDVDGQIWLYDLVRDYAKENHCAVLLISHNLHLVMSSTDRVLCMQNHICCSGNPQEISIHPTYQKLFGAKIAAHFAIYKHNHSHSH